VPFSNHFELAAFIYNRIQELFGKQDEEITMGRADILFNFLKIAGMDKPEDINKYIENISIKSDHVNIVQQLVEMILEDNPSLIEDYQKSKDITGKVRV